MIKFYAWIIKSFDNEPVINSLGIIGSRPVSRRSCGVALQRACWRSSNVEQLTLLLLSVCMLAFVRCDVTDANRISCAAQAELECTQRAYL